MTTATSTPNQIAVDRGPARDAALILARHSTLADHVTVDDGDHVTIVRITDDIPVDLWGSSSQAIWRLLCAIGSTRHEVSLYEVVSRLDRSNRAAVAAAIAVLCA